MLVGYIIKSGRISEHWFFLDSLSKCIGADWLLLAEACQVEPKLCKSELAEISAKAFLLTLQKNWGRISRKEFLFRLKNYALDCGLNHLVVRIDSLSIL